MSDIKIVHFPENTQLCGRSQKWSEIKVVNLLENIKKKLLENTQTYTEIKKSILSIKHRL